MRPMAFSMHCYRYARPPLASACLLALCLLSAAVSDAMAQIAPSALTESRVDWAFPIAGGQGTTVTVNVWGRLLEGTTAVWTDSPGIRARIVRVENCPIRIMGRYLGNGQFEDESVQRGQRVELSVEIDQTTEVGGHVMRLVSPWGISNVLAFRVSPGDEQVVLEDETHTCQSNPEQAQRITTIPCSINGRIAGDMLGEVDYYAIDGVAGQEILCELFYYTPDGSHLNDHIGKIKLLFELRGLKSSWFDATRLSTLAMADQAVSIADMERPRLTYRFPTTGRYVLAVQALDGHGGPEFAYQLRIASTDKASPWGNQAWPLAIPDEFRWLRQGFDRTLSADRMKRLKARSLAAADAATTTAVNVVMRGSDPGYAETHPAVAAPALFEGTIAQPGQVDQYRLQIPADVDCVVEIEAVDNGPPRFYPWVTVSQPEGQSVFSNISSWVGGNNHQQFNKLNSYVTQSLTGPGEYWLQIRDLTSRHAGDDFRYRVMVRPKVPHLGPISLPDRINLIVGEELKVTCHADRREGCDGKLSPSCLDLPPSVSVTANGETLTFSASSEAPVSDAPADVRIEVRLEGQDATATPLLVRKIPLMVVRPKKAPDQVISRQAVSRNALETERKVLAMTNCVCQPETTSTPGVKKSGLSPSTLDTEEGRSTPPNAINLVPKPRAPSLVKDRPRSIRLVPPQIEISGASASQQFVVIGQFDDNLERDVTSVARFRLSDTDLATVSGRGVVTALADGQTVLTATVNGQTAKSEVTLRNTADVTPFSFPRDIVGIFTRNGCNASSCHGGVKGRGGLRLSLDGLHPRQDYEWIVRGGQYQVLTAEIGEPKSPRVHVQQPSESLLLRKATMTEDHEGGERFSKKSAEYAALLEWIRDGAPYGADAADIHPAEVWPSLAVLIPGEQHQLLVWGRQTGGWQVDLSRRVRFETGNSAVATVTPDGAVTAIGPGETTILVRGAGQVVSARVAVIKQTLTEYPKITRRNLVDEHVFAKLQKLSIVPSDLTSDDEFLRRVSLDLTGMLPPPDRVREFLSCQDPGKREHVIDALFESPEFVEYWTFRLSDLLRLEGDQPIDTYPYWKWIRDSVAQGKPFDRMIADRIAAQGRDAMTRHYGEENTTIERLVTEQVRVALGRRFDCNQCHDHPFESFSQDQFWGLGGFFSRVNFLDYWEVVFDNPAGGYGDQSAGGPVLHPRTKVEVQPTFLDGAVLPPEDRIDPRRHFGDWLVAQPGFAEAAVNRLWKEFFGRGLAEPIDDFRADNPPTHPELLQALAQDLRDHRHDLRRTMRLIVDSHTYQLSSQPNATNAKDELNYSHALPRPLYGEVLLDCVSAASGVPSVFTNTGPLSRWGTQPAGTRAINLREPSRWSDPFLVVYGRPNRKTIPERDGRPKLTQALHMLGGRAYTEKLGQPGGRLSRLLAGNASDKQILEDLFLATFSRFPTPQESDALMTEIASRPQRAEAFEDLLWALISSREFICNH